LAIVEGGVEGFKDHTQTLWPAIGLAAVLAAGFALGLAGLASLEKRLRAARRRPPIAGGAVDRAAGPRCLAREHNEARSRVLRTGMTIARRDRPPQLRRGVGGAESRRAPARFGLSDRS